jgi:hypothetical protein
MFIARAMCGLTYTTAAALCSSFSLQKYLERWPTALYEAGRSVLMLMMGSKIPRIELNTVRVSIIHCLCLINSSTLTWGLLRMCAACPTPRLNWRWSSIPPGTTSTIHSPPGLRRIQQPSSGCTPRPKVSNTQINGRGQLISGLQHCSFFVGLTTLHCDK